MKNKNIISFALTVLVLTVVLWGATSILVSITWLEKAPSFRLLILLILSLSTFLIYYLLQRAKATEAMDFVRNFLLSIVLKLILSGVLIMILIKLDPTGANVNALFFMISYLVFTAAEVTAIYLQKSKE